MTMIGYICLNNGDLNIIKSLMNDSNFHNLFTYAVVSGNLESVDYLYKTGKYNINAHIYI